MRKLILLLMIALPGCSTAPLAGFLDAVSPSKNTKPDPPRLPPPSFDDRTPR